MKYLISAMLVFTIVQWPAYAVKPMTADTLGNYCQNFTENSESTYSIKCIAYVGGFIDGAIATDERVAENVVAEFEKESFTERAIRTRIASRIRTMGPSVYADFCVGDPVPITEVIGHVVINLQQRSDLDGVLARTVVYDTLRHVYPCKEQ